MASITEFSTFVQALNSIQTSGPIFNYIKTLSDGVHMSSGTLMYLNKHAKSPFSGGDNFSWRIVNDEATNGGSYFGGTTLDTSVDEFLGTANIVRAFYSFPCSYYKTDLLQNQGKDMLVDYVGKRMNRTIKGLSTRLALDLFGNGTTDANTGVAGGTVSVIRPLIGMQLPLETTPTSSSSTYAAIARTSTNYYWHNQAKDVTSIAGVTLSAMQDMFDLTSALDSANGGVDLIIMPIPAYKQVWFEAKALQAASPDAKAQELGVPNSFTFNGATVIPEKFLSARTAGGYLTTGLNRIYFINTSDVEMKIDPNDNAKVGEVRIPTNQHSYTQHITWSGQIIFKTPPLHGVMYYA